MRRRIAPEKQEGMGFEPATSALTVPRATIAPQARFSVLMFVGFAFQSDLLSPNVLRLLQGVEP